MPITQKEKGLVFNEAEHSYTLGGVRLPSVTQILKAEGFIDDRHFTEESRDRGRAVHTACHFLEEGELDWDTVDPSIVGYVQAYERFLEETGFESVLAEHPMADAFLRCGGMLDRLGTFRQRTLIDGWALLDIKTGVYQPEHDIQLAGYEVLADRDDGIDVRIHNRIVLELKKTGRYKLEPTRTDPHIAREVFRAAVKTYHWKESRR